MVFPIIFATEIYFYFWVHIILITACTIFVSMKYFTFSYGLLLSQLINLTSVSFTLFIDCISAIFENITNALYKHKRPCKAEWNVYMGEKYPTKSEIPVLWTKDPISLENLFSCKQIFIFK